MPSVQSLLSILAGHGSWPKTTTAIPFLNYPHSDSVSAEAVSNTSIVGSPLLLAVAAPNPHPPPVSPTGSTPIPALLARPVVVQLPSTTLSLRMRSTPHLSSVDGLTRLGGTMRTMAVR